MRRHPAIQARAKEYLPLVGLVAAAALLRLLVIDARSLWFDETFSIAVARLPWRDAWGVVARTDLHPPLYYLLLHLWLRIGDTPAAARLLSVLIGVLTVAATWFLAREIGGRVLALVSTILLSAATLAIQASVEARMYPLLGLTAVTTTWLLWRAVAEPARWRRWVAYAAVLSVALYVDYRAGLLIPAHILFAARLGRRGPVRGSMLVAVVAAVLLYAPWWSVVARQLAAGQATTPWTGSMPATAPLNMVALSSFGGYLLGLGGYLLDEGRWRWPQILLVLPFLALVFLGAVRLPQPHAGALLLLLWLGPIIMLVAASLLTGVFYAIPRTASFVQPFFIILLAQGIITLTVRARRPAPLAVLVGGMVVLNLSVLRLQLADPRYQPYDWAGAARQVHAGWGAGDRLIFYPQSARVAFGYYFRVPEIDSITLYSPPWSADRTPADYAGALPPVKVLAGSAPRLWLVVTEPTPPGSLEALLGVIGETYRLQRETDFRHVYVMLYEMR